MATFFKSCKKWFENCPAKTTGIIKALFVFIEQGFFILSDVRKEK